MKVLANNKKAFFEYEILEKFEAGLVLNGQEVKSIRLGHMSLKGSYIVIRDREPYLIGANIPPYQPKNTLPSYDPERSRALLLNKKEIDYLESKTQQKGLTLIPLKVYTKYAKIKLEMAIAKGKGKADKREAIKKRDTDRDIKREINIRG